MGLGRVLAKGKCLGVALRLRRQGSQWPEAWEKEVEVQYMVGGSAVNLGARNE